jgi:AAA15 family ATPase/GTPase
MVDLGLSEMIPLTQVGQGINRLVAMFSEIVGEQPGVCLIDEIENGIHHSLLQQIWTGIAASAAEMDVQV